MFDRSSADAVLELGLSLSEASIKARSCSSRPSAYFHVIRSRTALSGLPIGEVLRKLQDTGHHQLAREIPAGCGP